MLENLEDQRRQKFKEALEKTYIGCIFDIDGTLTVRGDEFVPAFMYEPLSTLSMKVPMAICTGRKLSHAYEKMAPIFTHSSDPFYAQSQWFFICENGSIGYVYDSQKKQYEEFYRVPYPYPPGHRGSLFSKLNSALSGKLGTSFLCEVSMVFRPLRYDSITSESLMASCNELLNIIAPIVQTVDPKSVLKIGNSGTGVIVFPYQGNKERGTQEFARYLHEKKGFSISPNAVELVVVGDQPGPYGNDETFLDGRFGMPFTVDGTHPQNLLPLPVYDVTSGAVLKGPEATIALLQQLKFRS